MDNGFEDQFYYQGDITVNDYNESNILNFETNDYMFNDHNYYPIISSDDSTPNTSTEFSFKASSKDITIPGDTRISPNTLLDRIESSDTIDWNLSDESLSEKNFSLTNAEEINSLLNNDVNLASLLSSNSKKNTKTIQFLHLNPDSFNGDKVSNVPPSENLLRDDSTILGDHQIHFGDVDDLSINFVNVKVKQSQNTNDNTNSAFETALKDSIINSNKRTRRKLGENHSNPTANPGRRKPSNDLKKVNYILADDNSNKLDSTYTPLSDHQIWNGITIEHIKHLNTNQDFEYQANPKFNIDNINLYEPAINKKSNSCGTTNDFNKAKGGRLSEGNWSLCPLCPVSTDSSKIMQKDIEKNLYRRNDSNYLHHMIQFHGIFSNGDVVEEPIYRGFASCKEEKFPVEVIECTYCNELIKLKKIPLSGQKRNRFLKYLRHVKDRHYSGKNKM